MTSQQKVIYDGTNFDAWMLHARFLLQPYYGYLDGGAAQLLIDERLEKNKDVRRSIRQQFYMTPGGDESLLEKMLNDAELDDRHELTPSELRKWTEGNRRAISALASTLSIDFQGLIASKETFSDAWSAILESHKGGDRYAVIYHIRDLIEHKLNDPSDLIMFIRNKADAARRVKSMGIKQLSNEAIDFLHASALTLGLPDSMVSVRRKLEDLCKNEAEFTPLAVERILIDENARYNMSSSSKVVLSGNYHPRDNSAMVLNGNYKKKKFKALSCGLCGRVNHEVSKCFWNPHYDQYGSDFAIRFRKKYSKSKPSDSKYAEFGIPIEKVYVVHEEPKTSREEDDDEQHFNFAYVTAGQTEVAAGVLCDQDVSWESRDNGMTAGANRDHESAWETSDDEDWDRNDHESAWEPGDVWGPGDDGTGTFEEFCPGKPSEDVEMNDENLYVCGRVAPDGGGPNEHLSKLFF